MAALNDDQRDVAVNLAFELAKLGIQRFANRRLNRAEEDELLAHLRELEAARTFKTPSELVGDVDGGQEE